MYKYKIKFDSDAFTVLVSDEAVYLQEKLDTLLNILGAEALFIGVVGNHKISTLLMASSRAIEQTITFTINNSHNDTAEREAKDPNHIHSSSIICTNLPNEIEVSMNAPIANENAATVGMLIGCFAASADVEPLKKKLFETVAEQLSAYLQKCFVNKQTTAQLGLLNDIQSLAKIGAWEFHYHAKDVFWSDEIYRIYGVSKNQSLTPNEAMGFYAPQSQEKIKRAFHDLTTNLEAYDLELAFTDAGGNAKWVRTTGNSEVDQQGKLVRVYGTFEDVTEARLISARLKEHSETLENILNNLNDAVITINCEGQIRQCNEVAVRLFGYDKNELIGANVAMLMPQPYAMKHDSYMQHYKATGEAKIIGVGRQLPARRKNGDVFQMELSLTESVEKGEKQYIGLVRDITERLEAQDAIYNLAFTDNVTQLRNSQWFEREAKELMFEAMRKNHCIYAVLLDVDKMASFNQRFGFNAGDKALKQIADKLQTVIGNEYAIFKFDADAFIILSRRTACKSDTSAFGAHLLESALLNAKNYKIQIGDARHTLSCSAGSAIFDPSEHSFETMLIVLEHALRNAKKSAPFGLCHLAKDGIREYDKFVALQEKVHSVVKNGELGLAFQPQFNVSGNVVAFEALVRWHSPDFGWVSPADFIPIAEENGAIYVIGEWVVSRACDALNELITMGIQTTVAINISAMQIVIPEFSLFLIRTLKEKNIAPQLLLLELTETALVSDMTLVRNTMHELAELGFRFSIDDFGTGYSSLAYLKELPIAELKVDKYFVDDIDDDSDKAEFVIVDAIINIAKALGVQCVAEGVENEVQRNYLSRIGCDIFQGYHFSKPLLDEEWRRFIRSAHFS